MDRDGTDLLVGTGRVFTDEEKRIRDAGYLAQFIQAPLFMEHGTADKSVWHEDHTMRIEKIMKDLGKPCHAVYYEGGGHDLEPTTSKLEAFRKMFPLVMETGENPRQDDFAAKSVVVIPCGARSLKIDWSKPASSQTLFQWV